jgi:hypothetical protein
LQHPHKYRRELSEIESPNLTLINDKCSRELTSLGVLDLSKYPPRPAGRTNLVVGIALILFSIFALMSVITNNVSGSSLTGPSIFIFVFVFMGGYEIGKYAENRIINQNKTGKQIES